MSDIHVLPARGGARTRKHYVCCWCAHGAATTTIPPYTGLCLAIVLFFFALLVWNTNTGALDFVVAVGGNTNPRRKTATNGAGNPSVGHCTRVRSILRHNNHEHQGVRLLVAFVATGGSTRGRLSHATARLHVRQKVGRTRHGKGHATAHQNHEGTAASARVFLSLVSGTRL